MTTRKIAYHLDLHQSFVAIVQQVAGLAAVDADNTEQQLAAKTEGERRIIAGSDDGVDTVLEVVLKNLDLGDLALLVGREPCLGQGAGGAEERARPEHGGDDKGGSNSGEQAKGRGGGWSVMLKSQVIKQYMAGVESSAGQIDARPGGS